MTKVVISVYVFLIDINFGINVINKTDVYIV